MVTEVPSPAPEWAIQTTAQRGWPGFEVADFVRLKRRFGVDWALVSYSSLHGPQSDSLACQWHNYALAVCKIP